MRASFQGQNIFALGHGIAMLKSAWTEAEPPQMVEERTRRLKGEAAALAKAALEAGIAAPLPDSRRPPE